jgi:drug/metabolite transporter (DMT)-like permease
MPITIALGQRLFLRRPLPGGGWLGIALATAGVALVALSRPPDFARARFGDALQLASCLTWTAYTLLAARPLATSSSLSVTFLAMLFATVPLAALALARGALVAPHEEVGRGAWLALSFLGLACSGLAMWLWSLALRRHEPARVGAMLYFEPFVTLLGAKLLLDEPLTGEALAGGLLVIAGVLWLGRASARRRARG